MIYGPDNQPAEASPYVMRAMANAVKSGQSEADGLTHRIMVRLTKNLTPVQLASYLDEFYQGKFRNIALLWYALERSDDAISPVREKRFSKVLANVRNHTIEKSEDTPEAEAHADTLRRLYAGLTAANAVEPRTGGLVFACECLLNALGHGYANLAKRWTRDARTRQWSLHLTYVPAWYFSAEKGELHYHANPDTITGQPVDAEQWIAASRMRAIMEPLAATALFKRLPMQQLVRVLEKWGVPNIYGKTGAAEGSDDWNKLYAAILAYMSDMPMIAGGDAEVKEIASSFRSANLHTPWIERCDRLITVNWLGGDLGTFSSSGSGTLAGGAQASDLDEMVRYDCDWLTDILNDQVDPQVIRLEHGRDAAPLARIVIRKPDNADDKADMNILKEAVELGAQVPVAHLYTRYSLPEADAGDDVLITPQSAAGFLTGAMPNAAARQAAGASRRFSASAAPRAHAEASFDGRQRAVQARSDLDQLAENTLQPFGAAYAAALQPLFDAVADLDEPALAGSVADNFQFTDEARERLADTVGRAILMAAVRGYVPCRDGLRTSQIERANAAVRAARAVRTWFSRANAVEAVAEMQPLPFDEAIQFWSSKVLVADFADLERLDFTVAEARALGLKVAGITERSALGMIKDDIARLVEGGEIAPGALARELQAKYDLNAVHAETVVRTNVQSAYQWGHYQQLDALRADFALWAFDVVEDEDTSDICNPLTRLAYPAGDSVFSSLYPPNHYRCRTSVIPMSRDEATAQGFTVMGTWPRNPENGAVHMASQGFETNIGTVPLRDIYGDAA